ncbi:MAG: ABC transporter ATP-binding protein [Clostridia bacterium]|nr:ABC transporter ATP-binding protein [Clostridia bacterium]MEE1024173.1 ABC transporter ATP-binding protein [Acutalibacteraceae bacterium]
MIIRAENLYKKYKVGKCEVNALCDVSFCADKGEFVAIIGSSGSGKSTLMNILGCLDKPDEGKYYIDGFDTSVLSQNKLSKIRSKKIGFIFQRFNLIPTLTALQNVELPMMYLSIDRNRRRNLALSALERVGLKERAQHTPGELSGGQQQRVAVARALVTDADILLCDEPTGNLDSASGKDVMNLIKECNDIGKTVILITHDHKMAAFAHRAVTINDGKVIDNRTNVVV